MTINSVAHSGQVALLTLVRLHTLTVVEIARIGAHAGACPLAAGGNGEWNALQAYLRNISWHILRGSKRGRGDGLYSDWCKTTLGPNVERIRGK
jgi:hypothetical protein